MSEVSRPTRQAIETPPGFVAVPVGKGCLLLLTDREYVQAVQRGKRFRRRAALARRIKAADER